MTPAMLCLRSVAVPSKANSVRSQANSMGVIDFLPALHSALGWVVRIHICILRFQIKDSGTA
jgi:hypothetical protein